MTWLSRTFAFLCAMAICACTSVKVPGGQTGSELSCVADRDCVESLGEGSQCGVTRVCLPAPTPSLNRAPLLLNFRVESGQPTRVLFDSSEPIQAALATGLVVSGRTVTTITVVPAATTGHSVEVAETFDHFDNNTIRYDGGGDIVDLDGNPLHPFSLRYIDNLIAEPVSAEERFATSDAAGGGDGLSEATAWTLSEAAAQAVPGQTVWVKAGRYAGQEMTVAQSGTPDSPIKFVGYRSTPGDITSMYYAYPAAPDFSEMPTLDGGSPEFGRNANIRGDYLIFRNFQSVNINGRPFLITSAPEGVVFDNCVVHNAWTLNGVGFHFNAQEGQRNRVINSIAVNTSNAAVLMAGDFSLIENVRAYGDGLGTASGSALEGGDEANAGYLGFDGSDNVMRDVWVERVSPNPGNSRGIFLSSTAANPVENCLVENSNVLGPVTGLEFRHQEVRNNVVRNVGFFPGNIPRDAAVPASGAVIRDGANNNRIESCYFNSLAVGVRFRDNNEQGAQPSGDDNVVVNSLFNSCVTNISAARETPSLDGTASNNRFVNCTFHNAENMYADIAGLLNNGTNSIVNSIISGTPERFETTESGFEETNNAYWMSYPAPMGAGNLADDPMFVDTERGDFRLGAASQLIDVGVPTPDSLYDAQGVERPQGGAFDLGAFEFYTAQP